MNIHASCMRQDFSIPLLGRSAFSLTFTVFMLHRGLSEGQAAAALPPRLPHGARRQQFMPPRAMQPGSPPRASNRVGVFPVSAVHYAAMHRLSRVP